MNPKWTGRVLECGGKRSATPLSAPCEPSVDIQAGCDVRTQSGVAASLCHRTPKPGGSWEAGSSGYNVDPPTVFGHAHRMSAPNEGLLATPLGIRDFVTLAVPDDERLWVPQAANVWFRPLILNTVNGEWVNLLRVRRSGVLSRHRHPAPVYGYVIKGSWRYLEHQWTATQGSFVFEPPGEVHTLVVDADVEEMITLFHVCGALIYYNDKDQPCGHDDVHTKIQMCRRHFEQTGLGADFVKQFVR